ELALRGLLTGGEPECDAQCAAPPPAAEPGSHDNHHAAMCGFTRKLSGFTCPQTVDSRCVTPPPPRLGAWPAAAAGTGPASTAGGATGVGTARHTTGTAPCRPCSRPPGIRSVRTPAG